MSSQSFQQKISIDNWFYFYAFDGHIDTEFKSTPFAITQKWNYLGILLGKHVQDLSAKNYKTDQRNQGMNT